MTGRCHGDADRQERQSDGDDVRLVPGRRHLRRVPEDRTERQEDGPADPDGRSDRQATEHPPADRDVERGEDREDRLVVSRETPGGHERQENDRREGRERQQPARHAVAGHDRQDVLEERVA
jgi:hypothetical protein